MRWLWALGLVFAAHGAAAENWVLLGTSETGAEIYVDRATRTKSGDIVSLWMMENYPSPRTFSGKTFSSARLQHEYDCKQPRRRTLQSTLHSGGKASGMIVLTSTKATEWRAIPPSTVGDTLWRMACGKK